MSFLALDTETTSLPISMSASVDDLDNWPRVLQLGWCFVFDKDIAEEHIPYVNRFLIIPDGPDYQIHPKALEAHGLTLEECSNRGVSLQSALSAMSKHIDEADFILCHNAAFDIPIVGAEFLRAFDQDNPLANKPYKCTMKSSTSFVGIRRTGWGQGPVSFKWPTLQELHQKLFGYQFDGAHDAGADVEATIRCYYQLKKLKVMS